MRTGWRIGCAVMLMATCAGAVRADEPEPTWGRVFGVYSIHATKSSREPEFPFHTQLQVNPAATATSGTALSNCDVSALDSADVASLPAKAFEYTCYSSEENANYMTFVVSNLTAGAGYRLSVYVNEPYMNNTRSEYMVVNGARLKNAGGEDFWFDPCDINFTGTKKAKAAWKFVVSNVVAQANGTISWGFPRKSNKSVMNVVTIEGTNAPAKPRASVAKIDATSALVKGGASRDALAYYFERRTGENGAWTTVGRSTEPAWTDTTVDASQTYSYRVIASNGVGTAVSEPARLYMRAPLYALNVGTPGEVVGRFMPAETYSPSYARIRNATVPAGNVPAELSGCERVGSTFGYIYPYSSATKGGLSFTFTNLVANTTYNLRVWTLEPWGDIVQKSDPDTVRMFSIYTNGAMAVEAVSAYTLADHVINRPVPCDFTGTTDADGKLVVLFRNRADVGIISALELFEPADAAPTEPDVRVASSPDVVRLVLDARSAAHRYEVQYRDSDAAAPTTLFSNVTAYVEDVSLPVGVTRQYRVRLAEDGVTGPWSDWVAATRGGRSPYAALRVNHTYNAGYMANPPAGWVDGMQFLTSTHASYASNAYNSQAMDFSLVTDPAPEQVYRTQFFVPNDGKDSVFTFPGFDPALTYKVRVHMLESWSDAQAGTRVFALATNGKVHEIGTNWKLDVYVQAGNKHNTAVVYEMTTRANLDGTVRLVVVRDTENATIRGTEIIPVGTAPAADGAQGAVRASWYANAVDGENVAETCGTTQDHAGLVWRAADVPAACAGGRTRLFARANLHVPWTGTYVFTAKANGRVRMWIGDRDCVLNASGCQAATPVSSRAVALTAGCQALVFEYLQGAGADFAAELAWTAEGGMVPALATCVRSTTEAVDYGAWKLARVGSSAIPSYAVCRDAAEGAWRVAGSGYDLWGGSSDGTFLHRTATGTFEMKMRVTARGGAYVLNSRLGVSVRSTLGALTAADFALYAGLNGDASPQFKGYEDVDFVNGANWVAWGSPTPLNPGALPHWVKLVRENHDGQHRYIASVSSDGETWYAAKTQDVARVKTVYVGPLVMAHTESMERLAWIDVDHLEFVDTTPKGLTVFIR